MRLPSYLGWLVGRRMGTCRRTWSRTQYLSIIFLKDDVLHPFPTEIHIIDILGLVPLTPPTYDRACSDRSVCIIEDNDFYNPPVDVMCQCIALDIGLFLYI